MIRFDPARLARRQLELDRHRTARFPHLFDHKTRRMTASPLALLRGSAPLFYEIVERHPSLHEGPAGEGWLVGDAHVENFGAYRVGALKVRESGADRARERVVFDLNDFDDAFIGPWRLDLLRLLTSLVLAGREAGADGLRALALCDALLDAYVGSALDGKRLPARSEPVSALVEQVRVRTRRALLDARTNMVAGRRRFALGERYAGLSPGFRARAERAFGKYAGRLPKTERASDNAFEVVDAAFRIAGTGSLGCVRIAILTRGKGGPDGAWIFDMKSESAPAGSELGHRPDVNDAERVCLALSACLGRPPRMIATTRLRGESMFVRRLSPQEDRVDLARVAPSQLEPLARDFGALLGAAHRRGATRPPRRSWTRNDRSLLVERALALAGLHESLYLTYCELVRR